MKDHTGRAGGEKEEERRKSGCERRDAVTIGVKNDSFEGGVGGRGVTEGQVEDCPPRAGRGWGRGEAGHPEDY